MTFFYISISFVFLIVLLAYMFESEKRDLDSDIMWEGKGGTYGTNYGRIPITSRFPPPPEITPASPRPYLPAPLPVAPCPPLPEISQSSPVCRPNQKWMQTFAEKAQAEGWSVTIDDRSVSATPPPTIVALPALCSECGKEEKIRYNYNDKINICVKCFNAETRKVAEKC